MGQGGQAPLRDVLHDGRPHRPQGGRREGQGEGREEEVVPPRSLLQERLALPLMRDRGGQGGDWGQEAGLLPYLPEGGELVDSLRTL